jgi:type 1 glutamine amidotransferase
LKQLDDSGFFQVDVATSPLKGESLDKFNPKFKKYDVVVTTYDGDSWSARTKRNLENYVMKGGGLVVIHAANNAFADWEAYNKMVGIGSWGNRLASDGPALYIDDSGQVRSDTLHGAMAHHGPVHEYVVHNRQPNHPIMQDIPTQWMHTKDELYDRLRGPAENMQILATAFSEKQYEGTQRHEPVLVTVEFEKGRIFHSMMGHDRDALACVGFMTVFIRGCQWAAQREVLFDVPDDFPTERQSCARAY